MYGVEPIQEPSSPCSPALPPKLPPQIRSVVICILLSGSSHRSRPRSLQEVGAASTHLAPPAWTPILRAPPILTPWVARRGRRPARSNQPKRGAPHPGSYAPAPASPGPALRSQPPGHRSHPGDVDRRHRAATGDTWDQEERAWRTSSRTRRVLRCAC